MLRIFQAAAAAAKDAPISVSRVTWSPDGSFVGTKHYVSKTIFEAVSKYLTGCFSVGIAFTKHLIHLYAYTGSNELTQRIEVIFFFFTKSS